MQVQEVVLSADMQCERYQKRVTDIIAKMNGKLVCYVPFSCNLEYFLSRVIFLWISLLHMFGKLLIDFEGLLEKNCFLKINN